MKGTWEAGWGASGRCVCLQTTGHRREAAQSTVSIKPETNRSPDTSQPGLRELLWAHILKL